MVAISEDDRDAARDSGPNRDSGTKSGPDSGLSVDQQMSNLHHLLSRAFFAIRGHLGTLQDLTPASAASAHTELEATHDRVLWYHGMVNDMLDGLNPSPLRGRTLQKALQDTLEEVERSYGLPGELVMGGSSLILSKPLAADAIQIAQAAIMNAARHANATMLRVGLIGTPTSLSLLVEDNGDGFDVEAAQESPGLGIRQMHERVYSRGGSLTLTSDLGWGTSVRVQLPRIRGVNPGAERVRVVIVEPRHALRVGLGALMNRIDPSITITAELETVADARSSMGVLDPAVILVGLSLHDETPPLIAHLKKLLPDTPVIVISTPYTSPNLMEACFTAGAAFCVDAAADGHSLVNAVLAGVHGQASITATHAIRPDLVRAVPVALTSRESEVSALVQQGMADREIATALTISVKTVEKHVSSVLRKSGVKNRMQLLLGARGDVQGAQAYAAVRDASARATASTEF